MNFRSAHPFAFRLKPKRPRRSGAAVIELAAILPVFVLLLLGTIETCNMIFLQQSLKIAAYEGARITIVPATDQADVESAVSGLLAARRVNGATVTITPNKFQSAPYGSFIRVDVSAPCNSNTSFALRFYGSETLTGTVEMMKEF